MSYVSEAQQLQADTEMKLTPPLQQVFRFNGTE